MTGFSTRAIHAGQNPDPHTGSVIVPIHATSTFAQDGVGGMREGYEYARTGNPTRTALETCLAALEGGRYGRAFASGMAATDALLRATCRPGDHLIIPDDAYGGMFRLIDKVFRHWGIEHTAVGLSPVDAVRAAVRPTTRVVWCETPTNPLLSIADIAALAGVAHEAGALLVVD
ncbi:MAG TPA: aminotransferase class I/II-fold pyridoxal phosphate-dependent enzyme, partial [Pseudonocardiaceae bacterium]|nr:aminotransferase class I/II-fold pyridoxal phosphate-dependent enzyme [Pseudonocardiaceae bacterium]